jgi:hypothetical protein
LAPASKYRASGCGTLRPSKTNLDQTIKTLTALIIFAAAIVAIPAHADSYPFKTLGQIGREQDAERRYNQRQRDFEREQDYQRSLDRMDRQTEEFNRRLERDHERRMDDMDRRYQANPFTRTPDYFK